tara:strand:+ start:1765 stop:2100 length:336 start_codon:yes stop_codon:yes gene_type:complete
MKVSQLKVGSLYRVTDDTRVGGTMGATPVEEASRLALYVLRRNAQVCPVDPKPTSTWSAEALIYLGPKQVYGGMNGDVAHYVRMHHFVRQSGRRLYIAGQHIKHIRPFTRA